MLLRSTTIHENELYLSRERTNAGRSTLNECRKPVDKYDHGCLELPPSVAPAWEARRRISMNSGIQLAVSDCQV